MEGCFSKALMSGTVGYGLGILLGGFMHSMSAESFHNPMMFHSIAKLPLWEQAKIGWRGFGPACGRMAKNFGKVGLIYSASECVIQQERGTHDIMNPVYAGCVTGGFLAMSGGPGAAATGCAGFAVFSLAIEKYMGHH